MFLHSRTLPLDESKHLADRSATCLLLCDHKPYNRQHPKMINCGLV